MKPYLFVFDFDGTAADTFKPSPHGINVQIATEHAVQAVFGDPGRLLYKTDTEAYKQSPIKLADWLLRQDHNFTLASNVYVFFVRESNRLRGFVPEGKGVPLIWDNQNILGIAAELLVRKKMQIYENHMDETWPLPCEGFPDFWRTLQNFRELGAPITTAIVSSGHEYFIRKSFELRGLPGPDILITEDDVRGKFSSEQLEQWIKPGPMPLELAYAAWLQEREITQDYSHRFPDKNYMIYVGDDSERDGRMALNAAVQFFLYEEGVAPFGLKKMLRFDPESGRKTFGHWSAMIDLINKNVQVLREGRPIQDFFAQPMIWIEGKPRQRRL